MNVRFGPDDEHAAACERLAVRVERDRTRGAGPPLSSPCRGRPGRAAAARVGGDQAVLVGLDRRDDVAHVALATPLELLEQEVADGCAVEHGAVERLVRDRRDATPVGPEAAAERQPLRVCRRCR